MTGPARTDIPRADGEQATYHEDVSNFRLKRSRSLLKSAPLLPQKAEEGSRERGRFPLPSEEVTPLGRRRHVLR
jgi:hypothetical protein